MVTVSGRGGEAWAFQSRDVRGPRRQQSGVFVTPFVTQNLSSDPTGVWRSSGKGQGKKTRKDALRNSMGGESRTSLQTVGYNTAQTF